MPNEVSLAAPPLPATVADLVRRRPPTRTLNDMVEELYLRLYNNDHFHRLLEAVYNEQAVEGSLSADDHEAARMIREQAAEIGSPVEREKLATIMKSLRVVLRRYNTGRSERRNMIGGELIGQAAE